MKAVILFLLSGISLVSCSLHAQSQEKVYSALILNVAKGIQWPQGYADKELMIGVVEYAPLEEELKTITSSIKLGGKTVQIKNVTGSADVKDCDVLFVPAFKAKSLPKYVSYTSNMPTLIITNKMDLAKQGSGVNFILVNGKLKYEINCKSIEARGMKISSAIKGMGILVN
jgi:hypothetical protein